MNAIGIKRCSATTAEGLTCRAPACRGDDRCHRHGGRRQGPKACTCAAYAWPHRPGGGLCRWPEQPAEVSPTKGGVHKPTGLRRRGWRRYYLSLLKLNPIRDAERIAKIRPRRR
jgi:hypothetical protein